MELIKNEEVPIINSNWSEDKEYKRSETFNILVDKAPNRRKIIGAE